jgi:hypothetical protein
VTGLREVKIKQEDSSDDKNMAEKRDKRSSDINAKLDVSVKKVITDTENIRSETSHVENRTGRQGSNTTGHIPTEDYLFFLPASVTGKKLRKRSSRKGSKFLGQECDATAQSRLCSERLRRPGAIRTTVDCGNPNSSHPTEAMQKRGSK